MSSFKLSQKSQSKRSVCRVSDTLLTDKGVGLQAQTRQRNKEISFMPLSPIIEKESQFLVLHVLLQGVFETFQARLVQF